MRNRSTAARRYDDAVARYGDGPSACLAALGLLSPGFLVLVFAAGRAAPGYSPLRDEVSELALGVTAAVLDGGLIGFGMLVCLFAAGLWRSFRVDAAGRCGAAGRAAWASTRTDARAPGRGRPDRWGARVRSSV